MIIENLTTPNILISKNLDSIIIKNKKFIEEFGDSIDSFKTLFDNEKNYSNIYDILLKNNFLNDFEVTLLNSQKSIIFYVISINPIKFYDNDAYTISFQNVTKSKNLERDLEEREIFFNAVCEHTKTGCWEYNFTTNKLTWTKNLCTLLDFDINFSPSPEEAMNCYAPESQDAVTKAVMDLFAGKPYKEDFVIITKEKRRINVSTMGEMLNYKKSSTNIKKSFGLIQDITEYKKQEELLKRKSEELNTSFNLIQNGLIITNVDGNITMLNSIAEKILGKNTTEVENKKIETFVTIFDEENNNLIASRKEKIENISATLITNSGNKFSVKYSFSRLKIQNDVLGKVFVFSNVNFID